MEKKECRDHDPMFLLASKNSFPNKAMLRKDIKTIIPGGILNVIVKVVGKWSDPVRR